MGRDDRNVRAFVEPRTGSDGSQKYLYEKSSKGTQLEVGRTAGDSQKGKRSIRRGKEGTK